MSGGIVILISGRGSNMQAVLEQAKSGVIRAPVSAVISNNSAAEGLAIAKSFGVPTETIPHRDYPTREAFDAALMQAIDRHAPKLVVLAGFMRILTDGFINHYQNRLINIHPSLLPAFPGLNTHQRALEADIKEHGATVHFVIPDIDAGPVVAQARVPVLAGDTPISLGERVLKEEHRILPMAVKWFMEDRLSVHGGKVLLDGSLREAQGLATP
jgi:phosphoribosylglycinamide formyltransferase 1